MDARRNRCLTARLSSPVPERGAGSGTRRVRPWSARPARTPRAPSATRPQPSPGSNRAQDPKTYRPGLRGRIVTLSVVSRQFDRTGTRAVARGVVYQIPQVGKIVAYKLL